MCYDLQCTLAYKRWAWLLKRSQTFPRKPPKSFHNICSTTCAMCRTLVQRHSVTPDVACRCMCVVFLPRPHCRAIPLIKNCSHLWLWAGQPLLSHTEIKRRTPHEHFAFWMCWESQTLHITKHIPGLLTSLLAGIMAFKHSLRGWVNILQRKTRLLSVRLANGSLAVSYA